MSATIYTDAYGSVTEEQYELYRSSNVTPAEHNSLTDSFGMAAHDDIVAFVRINLHGGVYREPRHMPSRPRPENVRRARIEDAARHLEETLHSADNGGSNGTPAKVKTAARALLAAMGREA